MVLWEADTPGCRIVGNYIALGSGGLADRSALRDRDNIVLGGAGGMSADNGCKVAARGEFTQLKKTGIGFRMTPWR